MSTLSLPDRIVQPHRTARYLGRQLVVELYGCPPELLADRAGVEEAMNRAAAACRMTIVNSVFHEFNPYGVSGAVIIAESHLAIHTWPEHGFAAVDVFTCGGVDPEDAAVFLQVALGARQSSISELHRGNTRMMRANLGGT